MMTRRLMTSAIVHESEVDSEFKVRDVVLNLAYRLERRVGRRIGWVAVGPLAIRDQWRRAGEGQSFILYVSEPPMSWDEG